MKGIVLNTRRILTAIAMSITAFTYGQDIHFSQFEYSPMNLNPALAGANSPMQGIINYRNQWSTVGVPFSTIGASFDGRLNENKRNRSGIFAAGINFFNDQSGSRKVNTTLANINLAYHLILDDNSTLGLGLQCGYGQRSFNSGGEQWMSQYDPVAGFNPAMSSGEGFNSPQFNYLDAGAGMVYTYNMSGGYMTQNIRKRINVGFSAFHLNQPYYSFINQDNERLAIRYSAFFNADFGIRNSRAIVQPGVFYHRQGGHQEIMMGTNFGYIIHEGSRATGFTKPITFFAGFYYRVMDAAVARFMIEYDMFSLGFAYDVNISALTPVSRSVGGFELFLRYSMGDGGGFRTAKKINRYRF
jgi:type IX secretion system PorP/SprF family membrane protein